MDNPTIADLFKRALAELREAQALRQKDEPARAYTKERHAIAALLKIDEERESEK